MHGLINRAIQCFFRDTYGAPAWGEVVRRLELDFTEFEPMLHYGNELTQRMIGEMAAALGKDRETVLEDVGTSLISNPAVEAPRRLLRFGGETFLDFLHSLDDLPDRARLAVEDRVNRRRCEVAERPEHDWCGASGRINRPVCAACARPGRRGAGCWQRGRLRDGLTEAC